jgi:DNA-binding beta-propeller fold protein YncE
MAISLAPRLPTIHNIPPLAKRIVAITLGLALAAVFAVALLYMQNRRPLTQQLPGLPAIVSGQQPSYATGLYGPTDAPLVAPLGVAVSPAGDRVYVTESAGQRAVMVFDRGGNSVGTLAPPDTDSGGRFPLYVAVDPSGTVYVSDRIRATIDTYSADGKYIGLWKPEGDAPASPMALTFDADANLYVTDLLDGAHRVLVYGPAGDLKLSFGTQGSDPGQFSFPNGVAVDRQGRIFVSDSNNGRVQVFDRTGHLLETIGRGGTGSLSMPRGVAIDPLDRVFIADITGQSVEVWDASAEPPHRLYGVGSEGSGNAQFENPNGIAVDTTGRLYVTDRLNDRVQVWSFQF